jgi:hypothetical protein
MTNKKSGKNVACWLCDHFQRYDREANPQYCCGECRFSTPEGVHEGKFPGEPAPLPFYQMFPWPVVEFGNDFWCGRFERSLETNLPAAPDTCNTEYVDLEEVHEWFWGDISNPWNKKILSGYVDSPEKGICCWNCDHFQPASHGNTGECRARPPGSWWTMANSNLEGWTNGYPATIPNGQCFWCAQWERSLNVVIAPPDGGWNGCPALRL